MERFTYKGALYVKVAKEKLTPEEEKANAL